MKAKKGSNFERQVCKVLSEWFSFFELANKRTDIFWRTAGSGARATVRQKSGLKTENSCGDISCLHESASKFMKTCNFEIKRGYPKLSVLNFIDKMTRKNSNKKELLFEWLEKAKKEAIENKRKFTIIIFKRDRKHSCVAMFEKDFLALRINIGKNFQYNYVIINHQEERIIIVKFLNFLTWSCPKAFFGKVLRRKSRCFFYSKKI